MGSLYTKFKIFHFQEKLDSLPSGVNKILAPLHIRIKPTNVCCHDCSYCAYRAQNLQLGKDMNVRDSIPESKMMEIIDDLIEMKVMAVTFSGGGEPFCYTHLLPTVQKFAASGIHFAALTNGSRMQGEVAEVFARHATWVRVSIDGWDNKSYAEFRGVSESEFTKVINNIKAFAAFKGKCYLGVSIIVNQKNAMHVRDLMMILSDAGVHSIKVSPCVVSNSGAENNKYHEPIFETVKAQLSAASRDLSASGVEIFDSYHTQLESFDKEYDWCPYLQILPIIGADLNVYSCQDKAYNLDCGLIGSIKDVRFKDFWFSDKNKFFQIKPSRDCGHHCVADGKNKVVLDYLDADKEHLGFV